MLAPLSDGQLITAGGGGMKIDGGIRMVRFVTFLLDFRGPAIGFQQRRQKKAFREFTQYRPGPPGSAERRERDSQTFGEAESENTSRGLIHRQHQNPQAIRTAQV